jgi:broad specificity phosphatase PhoE
MPVVLLVRHGQASFGTHDYDRLSDVGRRQSELVGEELARRQLRDPVVVHGTLRRQRDTAKLALEAAGWDDVAVTVGGRFDEYDHLELVKRYVRAPDDADPPTSALPSSRQVQGLLDAALLAWVEHGDDGGWPAFRDGALAAFDDVVAALDKGQDAVVVTSGGVIAALSTALLDIPPTGLVALNRVAANGAITKVVVGGSGASLVSFNEHTHVERAGLVTYR